MQNGIAHSLFVKIIIIFILLCVFNYQVIHAQKNIAGEYSLTGVMETSSGLQLNKDLTFNFYFSYGALDRYGSGKWHLQNSYIILDSRPYPGKDFKLTKMSSEKNKFITIIIDDKNKNLFSLVYCLVKKPGGDTVLNVDEKGIIIMKDAIDSIHLLSELCSERITSFPIDSQLYNSYTFEFEPWITEIFF